MRTLLINPFYPISETPSPPLGLAYLGAALEADGVEVRVLDLVVEPYSPQRLAALLETFAPDMVGATAVTMTFDHAVAVLADVKRLRPAALTVMGGPHVTFCAAETLRAHRAVDVVVLGEGDATVVELARSVADRREPAEVRGIVYRRGGDLHATPARDFIADIRALPFPARHLLPLGRYRALGMPVSLTTSRGCPFQCIFCVGRKMVGARVRYRDPVHVVDEMAYLASLAFHQINIADDLFTAQREHCLAVCDEILRRGLNVKWTSFARVDTVTPEILTRMRAAGCSAVSFGVESANAEILKTVKKGITIPQVLAAIGMCTDAGVIPHVSFILGLPGETAATLAETLAFGERIKALGAQHGFHLLAPFPGTAVRAASPTYDLKILSDDWAAYHANRAVCETSGVTRAQLDAVVAAWEDEFNAWLGWIEKRMATGEATPDEAWQLENLKRIVLIYDLMMQRLIEEHDPAAAAGPDGLEALAVRAAAATKHGAEEIRAALGHAVEQGSLRCTRVAGRACWAWVDSLGVMPAAAKRDPRGRQPLTA